MLIAGDCWSTEEFLLKSSAVSSFLNIENDEAARSMTIEATRKVIARSAVIRLSPLSDEFDKDFEVL